MPVKYPPGKREKLLTPGALSMKLGLVLGYWGAWPPAKIGELAQEAEKLGFDSVWSAESWGSDAFSPLVWIAAHTSTIKLGTGVVQISARTPTATAMARAHARPPVERPAHPRPRRVGPAGRRGLVRPAVRQAAGAHARVRRDRPARAARARVRSSSTGEFYPHPYHGAGQRRAGQAAQVDHAPAARRHPDLPRRRRTEERRA